MKARTARGSRPAFPADSGANAIVQALAEAGARLIFGVPGGGPNLDVVGAAAAAGLRFILARGETAAVIMAATCADLTGAPGTVVVTRGPGLASAVNGIAHAALDRLPVVVIADTVAAADTRISHQRIDQAALGRSVAKAAITVGGLQARQAAARVVRMALAAPPGPVIANMDDSAPGAVDGGGPDGGGPDGGSTTRGPQRRRLPRTALLCLYSAQCIAEGASVQRSGRALQSGRWPDRPSAPGRDAADRASGDPGCRGIPRCTHRQHPPGLLLRGGRIGHRGHDGVAAT